MGEGRKKGGSGGSNPLNFKVVGGTTQPASPKKNTIWVNTNVAITSYVFKATQPSASEGRVWIQTGNSSDVQFNALKKNWLYVYPISAKQYIGGAWVDKTAKSYLGGKWVDWIVTLYDSATGVENTSLLGEGGFSVKTDAPGREGAGSFSKTSNGITLNSNHSANVIYLSHNTVIDLSQYKKLHVIWSGAYGNAHITLSVHNTNKPAGTDNAIAKVSRDNTGEYESTLDISAITSGYIVLTAYNSAVTFKKIWMT